MLGSFNKVLAIPSIAISLALLPGAYPPFPSEVGVPVDESHCAESVIS